MLMERLCVERPAWYFRYMGEINTETVLELARDRALELGLEKFIVASETGRSALKALRALRRTGLKLVVVTHHPATTIGPKGDIQIGIPDHLKEFLQKRGAAVVQGTRPLVGIERGLPRGWQAPSPHTYVDQTLGAFGQGIKIAVEAALMATDAGAVESGEEVVSAAGTYKGLDSAIVAKTTYSYDFLQRFEVLEIIAKPRHVRIEIPEYRSKLWKGNLDQYYEPLEIEQYLGE